MSKEILIGGALIGAGYLAWRKGLIGKKPFGQNPEDWAKKWTEGQSKDIIQPNKFGPVIGTGNTDIDVAGDVEVDEPDWFLASGRGGGVTFDGNKGIAVDRWNSFYRQMHLPASKLRMNQLTLWDFEMAARLIEGKLTKAEGGYAPRTFLQSVTDVNKRGVELFNQVAGAVVPFVVGILKSFSSSTLGITGAAGGYIEAFAEPQLEKADREVQKNFQVSPAAQAFMAKLMRNPNIIGHRMLTDDTHWDESLWVGYRNGAYRDMGSAGSGIARYDDHLAFSNSDLDKPWGKGPVSHAVRFQLFENWEKEQDVGVTHYGGPLFDWNAVEIYNKWEAGNATPKKRTMREIVNVRARIYRALDFAFAQVYPYSIPRMLDSPTGKRQWGYDPVPGCYNWMAAGMVEVRGSVFPPNDSDTATRFKAPPWRATEVGTFTPSPTPGGTQVLTNTTTTSTQVLTTGQGGTTGNTGVFTGGGTTGNTGRLTFGGLTTGNPVI